LLNLRKILDEGKYTSEQICTCFLLRIAETVGQAHLEDLNIEETILLAREADEKFKTLDKLILR
jgi:hypothetical protein